MGTKATPKHTTADRPRKTPRRQKRAAKIMTEARWNKIVGSLADMWDSDEDFEQWLKDLYDRRRLER
jgi:hypothetical protein